MGADAVAGARHHADALPRRFCAGLDLDALHGASPERIAALLDELYVQLAQVQTQLGKPSVAVVGGAARGGGMTMAIACDMVIAGRSASFGYPEIDAGLLPAIHFHHLHRIVGRHRAFDLLFTGRAFDAGEAHALGLVSRLVDDATLLDETRALARQLADKSPTALRIGRAAFHVAVDAARVDGAAQAAATFCTLAVTPDGRECVAAYADKKRAPVWGG